MTSSSKCTPINETLVNDLAGSGFIAQQRNVVLVGGTGTGKTHLAIAIARSCIRSGSRGRFYNVVDLVNRLEIETRNGRQGRIADQLTRMDFIILDTNSGYLPFAQSAGGQLLFHLCPVAPMSAPQSSSPPTWPSANGPACLATPRLTTALLVSFDPPLRHRRDRQRQLALQEPDRRSHVNPRSPRLRNPDQLRRSER